jgi:hypothetical protein
VKLTQREREVASVAADLLMKGNPATRIAKYCLRKKMDLSAVYKLLKKMPNIDPIGDMIRTFHRLQERPNVLDMSEEYGRKVKEELENGKSNKS